MTKSLNFTSSVWRLYRHVKNHFYPCYVYVSTVFATATWLAGWLAVTCQYCVKMAKPILELFDHLVAPSF